MSRSNGYGAEYTTGFPFTRQDWIDYLMWLADMTHSLGMDIGIKNTYHLVNQNPRLVDKFDFAVNEGEWF
jgi:hypothetical protein